MSTTVTVNVEVRPEAPWGAEDKGVRSLTVSAETWNADDVRRLLDRVRDLIQPARA